MDRALRKAVRDHIKTTVACIRLLDEVDPERAEKVRGLIRAIVANRADIMTTTTAITAAVQREMESL